MKSVIWSVDTATLADGDSVAVILEHSLRAYVGLLTPAGRIIDYPFLLGAAVSRLAEPDVLSVDDGKFMFGHNLANTLALKGYPVKTNIGFGPEKGVIERATRAVCAHFAGRGFGPRLVRGSL